MAKRMLLQGHRLFGWRELSPEQITITGSILYEDGAENYMQALREREPFCQYYGLDPRAPIAVLFPKAILGFHKKARLWFPEWSQAQVDAYNQWFLDKYEEIAIHVKNSGWNFLLKMHPASYAAYWCQEGEEYEYWKKYPWIKVLMPEHTHAMFHHMAVGLGINTHSAMDTGYFRKPFIFIDSDQVELPGAVDFTKENFFCALTPGPSSHWHLAPTTSVNPWFPSWLGRFGRAGELPEMLADPTLTEIDETDWQRFIAEFWYKKDNKTTDRIVDFVMNACDQELGFWKQARSPRYWRGKAMDLHHRWHPSR
ncbi:MAG: hypothetical protein HQM02_13640, partial [Magnetococcales bacterium]|nr:hypothetical protein [Magnetococcales bacterium]